MEGAKPDGKLLQEPAKHEEKRFAGFDLVFEFERFLERFPTWHEFEQPGGFSHGAVPELNPDWAEPGRNRFFFQGRKLAQCFNPPAMKNIEKTADLGLALFCRLRF